MKELQPISDSYGLWRCCKYTANIFKPFVNYLPDPIILLWWYEQFRSVNGKRSNKTKNLNKIFFFFYALIF